ncbi:MAG: DUF1559 domain-containing protein [Planctomycetes bacterium]|nr:DUF1559 domain-containing protein [Planctomycetota bacterium]
MPIVPSVRKLRRSGFNMVELLTVLAIVVALAALLLPAVQQARESGRRAQCRNNLLQVGLALQNYQMAHRVLPPGSVNTNRPIESSEDPDEYHLGWIAQILPFLEQANTFHHIDFDKSAYAIENQSVRHHTIDVLNCPSQSQRRTNTTVGYSSYSGVHNDYETPINVNQNGVLFLNSSIRLDHVSDGCSSTLFVMEALPVDAIELGWISGTRATLRNGVIWIQSPGAPHSYAPHLQQMPGTSVPGDVGGPSSMHQGGFHVGVGDGSVRFLHAGISPKLLRNLCHRADGEMLDDF